MLDDEINCSQSIPEVEQPLANFESTSTPNVESAPTLSVETSFIPPPLSIMFRPPPIRLSAPIQMIFLDVLSHRINQPNYKSFISTLGLPCCQHSEK
ncbi:hypothetical protein HKD37_09G026686 [Glycine soja]